MEKIKKSYIYTLIILSMLVGITGCTSTNPTEEKDSLTIGLDYESIYGYKTKYVGDASKVSNLANRIYYSEYKSGISLKTDSKPYGVTVNYLIDDNILAQNGVVGVTDKMLKNAAIMFSLIDNVDNITFAFERNGVIYTFPFKREVFREIFKEDIRNYGTSFNKFRNELIPKLDREAWDKVDFEVYLTEDVELYVWRNEDVMDNDDIYYTILPGTNRAREGKEVYDKDLAIKDIEIINDKLAKYIGISHLNIRHDSSVTKDEMLTINEKIIFDGESIGIGVFDLSRKPLKYTEMLEVFEGHGYESGVVLNSDYVETELILYKKSIESSENLKAKRITINDQDKVISEEYVNLPEELEGYFLQFKEYNFSKKKYLLGYRYKIDTNKNKLYSDLFVINKEGLSQITILRSYELDYDVDKGIVPQGTIPTVVDFTVELIDDYIVYEDTDLYWKVQDVRSKEIYSSGENNPNLNELEPYYESVGEYIYVLKYKKDNSILAFNTSTKKFELLNFNN